MPTTAPGSPRKATKVFWWALRFLIALFLFVGALQVMKTGASLLRFPEQRWVPGPQRRQHSGPRLDRRAVCSLGFPGSSFRILTLVAAGSVSEIEGFTMLTGSRLGAAFVVLLVAVLYALRGGEGKRMAPVSTAVMALSTTALIYIPGAILGLGLLRWGPYSELNLHFPNQFSDLVDVIYGGILERIETWPAVILFLSGLGILLISFKLIDSVVPELSDEQIESSRLSWLRKKWPMFGLGCLVALIAMSVSVALTVLVPLVAKGYVKREDILPYIMGANITTLGDTLLAAFLLNSGAAVRIVMARHRRNDASSASFFLRFCIRSSRGESGSSSDRWSRASLVWRDSPLHSSSSRSSSLSCQDWLDEQTGAGHSQDSETPL